MGSKPGYTVADCDAALARPGYSDEDRILIAIGRFGLLGRHPNAPELAEFLGLDALKCEAILQRLAGAGLTSISDQEEPLS